MSHEHWGDRPEKDDGKLVGAFVLMTFAIWAGLGVWQIWRGL